MIWSTMGMGYQQMWKMNENELRWSIMRIMPFLLVCFFRSTVPLQQLHLGGFSAVCTANHEGLLTLWLGLTQDMIMVQSWNISSSYQLLYIHLKLETIEAFGLFENIWNILKPHYHLHYFPTNWMDEVDVSETFWNQLGCQDKLEGMQVLGDVHSSYCPLATTSFTDCVLSFSLNPKERSANTLDIISHTETIIAWKLFLGSRGHCIFFVQFDLQYFEVVWMFKRQDLTHAIRPFCTQLPFRRRPETLRRQQWGRGSLAAQGWAAWHRWMGLIENGIPIVPLVYHLFIFFPHWSGHVGGCWLYSCIGIV